MYLKTQVAKYWPGNVWQYYGRISALTSAGGTIEVASLSIFLEIFLVVAAALIVTLSGSAALSNIGMRRIQTVKSIYKKSSQNSY